MDDPKNQNVQPDYSFILNQNTPDAGKAPKNNRQKFIIIGGGIFAVLMIGLAVFAATVGNVQKQPTSLADATDVRHAVNNPDTTARAFYQNVADARDKAAYKMLDSTEKQRISYKQFSTLVAPTLRSGINLSKCIQFKDSEQTTLGDTVVTKVEMACPSNTTGNIIAQVYLSPSEQGHVRQLDFNHDI